MADVAVSSMAMPTAEEILASWDALAERFEFPGFNNMNYDTADARLHGFRDGDRWALVIEELVDWPGAGGLLTVVFAMGDIRGDALTTIERVPTHLYDDDGEPVVPAAVELAGTAIAIDAAAVEAACEQHDIAESFAVLLQLIATDRDRLFATDAELADRVAPGLQRIVVLDEWAHPDVYGGPTPSQSEAFIQLAHVLASGDVGMYAPTQAPNNRDWRSWMASK